MSKGKELVKNTLILGVGSFSSKFIVFFLLPVYTYFLTPDQFGVVDLIITYTALLAPFIAIQLDRGAFRYLIDARGDLNKSARIISNTLRIVACSLSVAFVATLIVGYFVDVPFIWLTMAVVATRLLMNVFMQFARGLGKNSTYAITSVVLALSTIALTCWLVIFAGLGIVGVLVSLMTANIIAATYMFASLKLYRYVSFTNSDRQLQAELLKFSLPLVPSAISWWTIQTADRTIISIVLGVASTGIYAAASRYAMIFNAFNVIFDLSWNESASQHINSPGRDKFFSGVYNTSFRLFATLGLLMITITPFVFGLIIGPDFQAAQLLVPLIITGAFLQSIVSQYSVIYIAKKITRKVLVTSLSAAAVSLALNIVLIHWIGLYAAPISMVVAFSIIAIWRHFDIKKYVTVTFTDNLFVKLALLYAVVIAVYYIGTDNVYMNVLNLGIALVCFWVMSRQTALTVFKQVFSKLKRT